MMPTLRQIERLNRFLIYLHGIGVSPDIIKFSRREDKPFIIIQLEPIHDIRMVRCFVINWEGVLDVYKG